MPKYWVFAPYNYSSFRINILIRDQPRFRLL